LLHLGGQQRRGELQLVLHLNLRDVGIGALSNVSVITELPVRSLVEDM
jgi:hypothetical protein